MSVEVVGAAGAVSVPWLAMTRTVGHRSDASPGDDALTAAQAPRTPTVRSAPAAVEGEAERARRLAAMKRTATGLLVVMTVIFVAARAFENGHPWLGPIRATAEAAMVGAIADWFAVTALFRHPLGLAIPHTAIIPHRKDEIGRGLGQFVQGNFLSGPVLADKLRSVGVAGRVGEWLAEPANAARLGAIAGDVLHAATEVLRDDDVAASVEQLIQARVRAVPAAPLAARLLDAAIDDGHHQQLLDSVLRGSRRLLEHNQVELRSRLERESPWWVPGAIDGRIFSKLYSASQRFLDEVVADPHHPVRIQADERVRDLAERLRDSPEMAARGEALKEEFLAHPSVQAWSSSLWSELKVALVDSAADPESHLRRQLEDGIVRLGHTVQTDEVLQAKIDGWVERTVLYLLDQYRDDIAELVSGTVARWDADDASRRIELQVGRDLQYIRINGTVVGGLAGLVIYTISQLIF